MDEMLLPVCFKGEELEFPVRLVVLGYTHRFVVLIEGIEMTFERDDQGEFRALIAAEDVEGKKAPDTRLLKAISEVLAGL